MNKWKNIYQWWLKQKNAIDNKMVLICFFQSILNGDAGVWLLQGWARWQGPDNAAPEPWEIPPHQGTHRIKDKTQKDCWRTVRIV